MPSYKIIPIPKGEAKTHKLDQVVSELSIRKDDSELRRGILPETLSRLDINEGVAWFTYGIEEERTYPSAEGEQKFSDPPYCKKSVVGTIDDCFFVVEISSRQIKDDRADIRSLLEEKLVSDEVSLEYEDFSQSDLKYVEKKGLTLLKADIKPVEASEPDILTMVDRGDLRATDIYAQYENDRLRQVKVELMLRGKPFRIGFKKNGTVILYEKSLTREEQMEVLGSMTSIISELTSTTFQTTFEWADDSESAPG